MIRRGASRFALGLSFLVAPLALPAGQAAAGEGAAVEQPMEVVMASTAVDHLRSGDKERVAHGLRLLDDLLVLEGFRRDTVEQALRSAQAYEALQKAPAKGKSQTTLRDELLRRMSERLSIGEMSKAAPLGKEGQARAGQLDKGLRAGFFTLGAANDGEELHVRVTGCMETRLQVVDGYGGALTPSELVDAFSGVYLRVPASAERFLHVRGGEGCEGGMDVSVTASQRARVLDAGAQKGVARLQAGQSVQVLAGAGDPLAFAVAVKPGGIYRLRTYDLVGPTDTTMRVKLGDTLHTNDDAGGLWGSQVEIEVLRGDVLEGEVHLKSSGTSSSYALGVEEVFRYVMGDDLDLSQGTGKLPASGWSGKVMPVSFPGSEGRLGFRVVAGVLYHFQGDFDMELVGADGEPMAIRLLREEEQPSWASRPVTAFVALQDGPAELVLRSRTPQEATVQEFFQVMSHQQSVHTPQRMALSHEADDADSLSAVRSENSSVGFVDDLEPGQTVWLRFSAAPEHGYLVDVDGVKSSADLAFGVYRGSGQGKPVAHTATTDGVGTLYWASDRKEQLLVRVQNTGDEAQTIRVGLSGERHYNGFQVGDSVTLRKHLPWRGTTNWSDDMEPYVGRPATITELAGRDNSGSWLVRVDLDDGRNIWRSRDLRRDH